MPSETLSDDDPIKWVTMMEGERSQARHMDEIDGKDRDRVCGKLFRHQLFERLLELQPIRTVLDRNLPQTRGADENNVLRILDDGASLRAELITPLQEPEERWLSRRSHLMECYS
jgi:hypothetical protein